MGPEQRWVDYSEAFSAVARLKPTVFDALIFTVAPVCGLRPLRAARFFSLKLPKPNCDTSPSFLMPLAMVEKIVPTMRSASAFEISWVAATVSIRSFLGVFVIQSG